MVTFFNYPSKILQKELAEVAKALTAPGKGILAADESESNIGKRFDEIKCINTEETRRQYRQLLFTAPNLHNYISGIIMFHETFYQSTDDGIPFVEYLSSKGILPGIKLDSGVTLLFGSQNEFTTQGFEDLAVRCSLYKEDGCKFARWRCVLRIGMDMPSCQAINENANTLARYAAICQSQGIVPIIETDILPNGEHDIERSSQVIETVLPAIYKSMHDHHVFLEGTLLKLSMVTPGLQYSDGFSTKEIGFYTVSALLRTVPVAVPGIVFLSANQTEEEASLNLNAINQAPLFKPWALTFSFARALQTSVLSTWHGKETNIVAAQEQLLARAKANSEASVGKYESNANNGGAWGRYSSDSEDEAWGRYSSDSEDEDIQ